MLQMLTMPLVLLLFHHYPDGGERPISNVSKDSFTCTEKLQPDPKGSLISIIFGLKKFYKYIYRRYFILVTDHRPLLAMFGAGKATSMLAPNRLSR